MLKLFNNQRTVAALLLRACLPAVASSEQRNTHILKGFRRLLSNSDEVPRVLPQGNYYVWSLISDRGDSLMKLQGRKLQPEIKCNGDFDDVSNLVEINDASLNANTAMISFQLQDYNEDTFLLSVEQIEGKFKVVVKPTSDRRTEICHRFIQCNFRGFSLFESCVRDAGYLGCKSDGSLVLVDVYKLILPDPRALFLMHLKRP